MPIGDFTAIVGQSNLGKSALVRAIKALARNAVATGLVRKGTKQFEIEAEFANGTVESLTRGAKASVFTVDEPGAEETWTHAKSGVKAPEKIEELWALPTTDGRELCITSQHDAPFLLAEPASSVAKVLGELTNAAMLMEAVREANRRRTEASQDEKARAREAEEAREELLSHSGLTARSKALNAAREAYDAALDAEGWLRLLETLLEVYGDVEHELAQITVTDTAKVTEAVTRAEEMTARYRTLDKFLAVKNSLDGQVSQITEVITNATIARSETEARIHDVLVDAGVCPLCGQGVAA